MFSRLKYPRGFGSYVIWFLIVLLVLGSLLYYAIKTRHLDTKLFA